MTNKARAQWTIVTAQCTTCGAQVSRALEAVEHVPNWRTNVQCTACREAVDPPDSVATQLLTDRADEHWRDRVTAFDAAAGFDRASLDPDANLVWQQRAHAALTTWLDPDQPRSRTGLMLCGPTGIGKTWSAFAVANEVASRGLGSTIRVASETNLMGQHVAAWDMDEHLRNWVDGASVLLIDDIGVAARHHDQIQSGWKILVDAIAGQPRSLLVVGTSNRQSWSKQAGLAEWMGQQAASRMRSWTSICTTGFIDRRTGDRHDNWQRQTTRSTSTD